MARVSHGYTRRTRGMARVSYGYTRRTRGMTRVSHGYTRRTPAATGRHVARGSDTRWIQTAGAVGCTVPRMPRKPDDPRRRGGISEMNERRQRLHVGVRNTPHIIRVKHTRL